MANRLHVEPHGDTHILVLPHRVPYPPNSGERIRTFHQLKAVRDAGFRITVCTVVDGAADRKHLEKLGETLDIDTIAVRRYTRSRWPALVRALLFHRTVSASYFFSNRLSKRFERLLDASAPDAVFCTSASMAEYLFRAGLEAPAVDRPYLVMDFMDVDSRKWQEYALRSRWPARWIYAREARLLERLEHRAYRCCDRSLLVSQSERDTFLAGLDDDGSKVESIGNGVTLHEPFATDPRPVTAGANLLFTGVMDYFPNEDAMLWFAEHVWPSLRARRPDTTLTIAGMRPTRRVRALARDPSIRVTGFVPDIHDLYEQADVFVAPLRIARGVQNKILESFSIGVPVVASREAADGIDGTHRIEMLVAADAAAFVEAIETLLDDRVMTSRMRSNARRLVEQRYSWSARTRPLVDDLLAATAARSERGAGERAD